MRTFVFVHVSKTAGTSLISAIGQVVPAEAVRGYYEATPVDFNGLAFVSSHANFQTLSAIPGEKRFLTAIRGPVERLISIYRFWQSITREEALARGYAHVLSVKEKSFEEFLTARHEPYWARIENEFTRTFCDAAGQLTDADCRQALENIDRCDFIFRTEHLSQDINKFFDLIGCSKRPDVRPANVTDSNHALKPDQYDKPRAVNLSELSDQGRQALAELTVFDQRLYNAAVSLAEKKRLNPIRELEDFPVQRPLMARGEIVLATPSASFVPMISRGWAPSENIVWSVGASSTIKFRVREGTAQKTQAFITFNACLLPNRNFLLVEVCADGEDRKTVLFVQQNVILNADSWAGRKVDVVCSAPRSAKISLWLKAGLSESQAHSITFDIGGAASPELLGWNSDTRALGVRFESIELA